MRLPARGRGALVAAALAGLAGLTGLTACSSGQAAPVASGYGDPSTCTELATMFGTNFSKDAGTATNDSFDTKMFTHANAVSNAMAAHHLTCKTSEFLAAANPAFTDALRDAAVKDGQVTGRRPTSFDEWERATLTPILDRMFTAPPPS